MSTQPPDQTPSSPGGGQENRRALDETSGFESISKTDETSAFSSQTKQSAKPERSRKKQPQNVGGYELGDMLGQGGMGRVFRADDSTGRSVALKLLSPDLARSPEALARFKQEGLIASQINHPHCVFVHRVDDDGGVPFIAMELMTGQTLKDLVLKNGPLPYGEAVRLVLQCIDGLIEAHSLGMIHRDIKPANCYLDDDGNVKIGDFGLARSLVSDSELTQTGAFLGTPLFASPEQLLGQSIDARSDIYSLSATMYYLLAGKAPFESPHAAQVIARIASSDPPSFRSAGVDVPPQLEQIVMKGLSRDASKRYGSFTQMRSDLLAIIEPIPEPTSLARRSVAWLLDYFILTSVIAVLMFSFANPKELQEKSILTNLLGMVVVFIYYIFCESIFAATLGKAALRVSVVDAKTGGRPSFTKVLARAGFTILASSLFFLLAKVAYPDLSPAAEGVLIAATFLLNLVILWSTWNYTGKRQLANDWISGTECRTRTGVRATSRSAIALPAWNLPVHALQTSDGAIPFQLGRFEITGEIDCLASNNARWFTAVDKQLERGIWIAYLTDPAATLDERQMHKPKSFRLRFVEEGSTPNCRWFAFVAPDGVPIMECAKQATHFPWPITRSILGEIAELVRSSSQSTGTHASATHDPTSEPKLASNNSQQLDAGQLWIDSAGRLSQVDFCFSSNKDRDIVALVSKLGLPTRHRLRKGTIATNVSRALLPIESLPPLRATRLLEQLASRAGASSSAELKSMLEKVDKQSHELTPSSRFVSAAASLGLMSPMMFFACIMLVIPSVILIADGLYKEIRRLKSLAVYAEEPNAYPEVWKFATDAEKSYWSDTNNRQEIQSALATQTDRMKIALDRVGSLERMILTNIPNLNLDSPPLYGSKREQNPSEQDNLSKTKEDETKRDDPIKVTAGPANVVQIQFGQEQMDEELARSILGSVERSKELPEARERIPDFFIVAVGMTVCLLWTTITFGGITKYFTGICFIRRDGRHLGVLRSFWRALLLYAPMLILAYLISYCNQLGFDYLGWGTILKRIFFVLPLAYLVTTVIWYRRTPLDVLSGTVAVPR
ncbi:MAG: protein kinase [Pirellula sp.]|jgi:serine/threonine protein kinase|nr:protein kinase [Pirellula sp.]